MSGVSVHHRLTRTEATRLATEIFAALGQFGPDDNDTTHCVMITAYGNNSPGAFIWKAELDQRNSM